MTKEWLAFTFKDQNTIKLTDIDLAKLLDASDKVVQNAYKRMELSDKHKWLQNTNYEVSFILRECNLSRNNMLIDFGCGIGRHAVELASQGVNVQGVDFVEQNIEAANKAKNERGLQNIAFYKDDCRSIKLEQKADAAICLYDVIGSYVDNNENYKMLQNIYDHLKFGGTALISVMNFELTDFKAKHRFSLTNNPDELLNIKPSNIMETTGNVFDPDFYWIDNDKKIVYRREQFKRGTALPLELFVRDKRFTLYEITSMCKEVGFEVVYARYVNAKDWDTALLPTDDAAKEILVKCEKNS
ncbi:MAG: class I SAM-dependent methyltransferase [Deferribacteraceae bacterium]|jgi:2-polyprenyl-3-methyl-5-hydroxy-6-metoxy-1,4-benzoquinol methylase|nr:class I SAM-dependent methyltransferase [Deferribacteraceae bacterium]